MLTLNNITLQITKNEINVYHLFRDNRDQNLIFWFQLFWLLCSFILVILQFYLGILFYFIFAVVCCNKTACLVIWSVMAWNQDSFNLLTCFFLWFFQNYLTKIIATFCNIMQIMQIMQNNQIIWKFFLLIFLVIIEQFIGNHFQINIQGKKTISDQKSKQ